MEKHIYNFFYKTRGVVSTFLVIILMPMITACSLFVDASRIKAAQAVIASSSDLALSTVLTNFDEELVEIYGLMASCQTDSDVIAKSKEYFKKSMVSQGLDPAYADKYSNFVASVLDGGKVDKASLSDLLGITVQNVDIKASNNGNLANAAILREQIVEFSKYRAPVDAIAELVNNLKNKVKGANYAKEESALASKTEKYYSDENTVLSNLQKAYLKMLEVNKQNIDSGTISKLKDTYLAKEKERYMSPDFAPATTSMYNGYHNAMIFRQYTHISVTEPDTLIKLNSSPGDVAISSKISEDNLKKEIALALEQYKNSMARGEKIISDNEKYPYNQSEIDEVQYWLQAKSVFKENLEDLRSYASDYNKFFVNCVKLDKEKKTVGKDILKKECYIKAYFNNGIKVTFISEKEFNREIEENGTDQRDIITTSISSGNTYVCKRTYNEIITDILESKTYLSDSNYTSTYNTLKERFNNLKTKYSAALDNDLEVKNSILSDYYTFANGKATSVGLITRISNVKSIIGNKDTEDTIMYYLEQARKGLDSMKTSYKNWGESFNNADFAKNSDFAKENKKVYDQLTTNPLKGEINPNDCDKYKVWINNCFERCTGNGNNVDNIRKLLDTMKKAMDDTKYNDIPTYLNASLEGMKGNYVANKITVKKSELSSYAESNRDTIFKEGNYKDIIVVGLELKNGKDVTSNYPIFNERNSELFRELKKAFGDSAGEYANIASEHPVSDELKKEDAIDKIKDKGNAKAKDNAEARGNKDAVITSDVCGVLPSNSGGVDKGGFTSDITAIGSKVSGLLTDFPDEITDMRDDLYVFYYIINMFSYDTIDKEFSYDVENDFGYVTAKEKKQKCRLTPTNEKINKDHNYAYGSEIEYLLYGNSTPKENISAAYSYIFAIRYVLNMIYAFSHFWAGSDPTAVAIQGLAAGVSAASMGVIPISLVKLIAILALTAAESANDIKELKDGEPVVFVKSKNTWVCQINAKSAGLSSSDKSGKDKSGIQYSDYLKFFLLMKFLTGKTDTLLLRTGDLIQCNMSYRNKAITSEGKAGNGTKFLMKKAHVYYELTAKCKTDTLMLALPIVKSQVGDQSVRLTYWNTYDVTYYRGY